MVGVKKNQQAIVWRIEGLMDTPPQLTMLINPSNLDLSYTPLINESRTLGGFVQEFWGEQLTTLSAAGQTAMFYSDNGITNKNSRISESYQNFMRLINVYKNNGKDYLTGSVSFNQKANPDRITSFGKVIMSYSGKEYWGYFEGFTVKELAEKPFNFEYNFSFKVIKIIGELLINEGKFIKDGGI